MANFQLELDKKKRELVEGTVTVPSAPPQFDSSENGHQSDGDSLLSEDDDSEGPPSLPTDLLNSLNLSESAHKPSIDRSTKPAVVFPEPAIDGQLSELIVPFRSIKEKFSKLARSNTGKFDLI